MSLEDEVRGVRAEVGDVKVMIRELIAQQQQTRNAVAPKLFRREDVAALFGKDRAWLKQTLWRGVPRKSKKTGKPQSVSKLGAVLVSLRRMLGGEEVWYPGDIAAHCKPWLGAGTVDDAA